LADAGHKGFAANGGEGMLRALLPLQKKLFEQGRFSPYLLAENVSLLGDKRGALAYLKTDLGRHDEIFPWIEGDPAFEKQSGYPVN
jgi:hypothetical protein